MDRRADYYELSCSCRRKSALNSEVAEEEGFEPPDKFPRQRFSRPPP